MRTQQRRTDGEQARLWEHYVHEHEQFNARLNLFLVAEAMLVVAAAQVLTSDQARPVLGLGISVTGICLTLVWAYVNRRQVVLMQFRRHRVRALDEFAEGDTARPSARLGSTVLLAYGIPAIVLVVWLWILVVSVVDVM
jgi:hypothetical protein